MDQSPINLLSNKTEEETKMEKGIKTHSLYRMVALDLDGTLLQSNHKMADIQAQYLRSLHSRGFTVCIATGRAAPSVYEHVQKLNFPEPIPVVCSNGALGLYCGKDLTKQEIFYNPVPKSLVLETLRIAKDNGHAVQYYFEDSIYTTASDDPIHLKHTETYSRLTGCKIEGVKDNFQSLLGEGKLPSKLLVIFDEKFGTTAKQVYEEGLGPQSQATIVSGAFDWFLEILHPEVTKGDGLKNICSALGIPIEECIAMGDGTNDIEFLDLSGLGIAMKNGKDGAKKAADVTMEWTNDQHGVMRTLQRLDSRGFLALTDY